MKIVRSQQVRIDLNPRDMEELLWSAHSDEQAGILKRIGERYSLERTDVEKQLCAVGDDVRQLSDTDRKHIVEFVESLLGWLRYDYD